MFKYDCTVKLQHVNSWPNDRLCWWQLWLAKPDLLCVALEESSDWASRLSLCSAAPQISPELHSTQLGLPRRAGRQTALWGQMQSTPKGSHRQEKEGDGNPGGNKVRKRKANLSLRSCGTLLPNKRRSQHSCSPNPYSDAPLGPNW